MVRLNIGRANGGVVHRYRWTSGPVISGHREPDHNRVTRRSDGLFVSWLTVQWTTWVTGSLGHWVTGPH